MCTIKRGSGKRFQSPPGHHKMKLTVNQKGGICDKELCGKFLVGYYGERFVKICQYLANV